MGSELSKRAEAVVAEMCALHPYAGRPAWCAIVERALSAQEEQIERLTARLQDTADASELRLQRLVEANDEIERLRLEGSKGNG